MELLKVARQIEANGIRFHVRVEGAEGAPWLVFSNSLATNLGMWEPQAERLARRFRVLRYDQRGHGGTEAPEGRYSFDTLLDDALAVMDALRIQCAHFCGLSMGGATALGLAERRPERVDRVIVCDSPCASTPATAQQWEERIAVAKGQGMAPLVEPTLARWFPAETIAADPPHIETLRQMIRTTPVNGFIGCAAALADHDFRSGVGAVTRPTMFLVGEKDGVVPAAMRELHAQLPGSGFVELPGAGHISNLDAPLLFSNAVEDFLAG
jgi:3-oxoadipate enol-lactonase